MGPKRGARCDYLVQLHAEPRRVVAPRLLPLEDELARVVRLVARDLLLVQLRHSREGLRSIRMAERALIATQHALITTQLAPIACVIDESMGRS